MHSIVIHRSCISISKAMRQEFSGQQILSEKNCPLQRSLALNKLNRGLFCVILVLTVTQWFRTFSSLTQLLFQTFMFPVVNHIHKSTFSNSDPFFLIFSFLFDFHSCDALWRSTGLLLQTTNISQYFQVQFILSSHYGLFDNRREHICSLTNSSVELTFF